MANAKKLIDKYSNRYRHSKKGAVPFHAKWRILDLFDRAEQWNSVNLPVWIPKPVTNMIRYVRTTKRANLAMHIPLANLTPATEKDIPFMERIKKGYEHLWKEQDVPYTIRGCIDKAGLFGTQIAFTYAVKNIRGKYYGENHPDNRLYEYDIKVKRLPITNFFPEPTATSKEDLGYFTLTEVRPWSDVKNDPLYTSYEGNEKKLKDLKFAELSNDNSANGEVFDRSHSFLEGEKLEGDEKVTVFIHWERFRNSDGKWQVTCTHYLENIDFFLYRSEDVTPNILPLAIYCDEEEDKDFWGTSICMDFLENQKIINKSDQTASIIGTLQQNPQKIVSSDSGINAAEMSKTGTLPGKVWKTNSDVDKSVRILEHPDIPNGTFELKDRMKADIREIAGINEAYSGDSVGSLTTSSGVDSLIMRATMRDQDKTKQIDRFVQDLTEILIRFMLHYWKEKRPLVIRAQNGQPTQDEWTPFTDEEIENLEYTIHSDVFAKSPITQQQRSQQADNLMQMQGQFQYDPPIITPEEWIVMKDFHDKEERLLRMQNDRQQKMQRDAANFESNILGFIQQSMQLAGQGMTMEQIQQQVTPQIDQLVQATFSSGTQQGTAGSVSAIPNGTISPTSMGNMTRG